MQNILQTIIATKQQEIALAKQQRPLTVLQQEIAQLKKPRDFVGALRAKLIANQPAIIAEIKKASPSKGIIREDFDPVAIANSYAKAGAACLSILTDVKYFQGALSYLQAVRATCELPILRKDFIVDLYQVYESRANGADCILLIVAALNDSQLLSLVQLAHELQLAVLVEVHNAEELQRALQLTTPLIGINNRDLRTFKTDLNTTLTLSKNILTDRIIITESGINTSQDVMQMRSQGINAFLVGETFMRAPNPGQKLQEIFG